MVKVFYAIQSRSLFCLTVNTELAIMHPYIPLVVDIWGPYYLYNNALLV